MDPAVQINIEYWFRLLYDCLRGACYGRVDVSQLVALLAHLWLWIIIIGYLLSLAALCIIVYTTMRIFELRKRESEHYATLLPAVETGGASPRWRHIEALMEGTSASEWREAIVEADIMLDDLLKQKGYVGEGVSERLKSADPASFETLQDAWEAHKVRNQIAHEGSAFELSEALARRTVARFENVFRELGAI